MDQEVKIVIVGDGATGKTCALEVFKNKTFPTAYVPTVFDNYTATVNLQGQEIRLSLFDTAGQDDYDRLRPLSYPNTDVFIILFSAESEITYENVEHKWAEEIAHHCPGTPIILACNKTDLRDDPVYRSRCLTPEQGEDLGKTIDAYFYCEFSAMESCTQGSKHFGSVDKCFSKAALLGFKKKTNAKMPPKLNGKAVQQKKKNKCSIL